ncbi:RagB/SusD family nutrient uptake outer membrane protein [Pedobacter glucosidilyticus]|uniref:RagB/SusD family nutrient uptake outer membrane protein n=1 Tax=Pedobacter glucosidilyticus TaxID=1122941 RepID=UPI0026EE4916|nr:RagB/SusD family nutrient uptake outer membrane protein [Pedobacter glucosidilyticus]
MKKLLIYFLLSSAILFQSCEKFLQEDPRSLVTPDKFFRTPADAVAAVNGVYVALLKSEVISNQNFFVSELTADDAFYAGTPVFERDQLNLLTFDEKSTYFRDVWANRYRAISRANEILLYVNSSNAGALADRVRAEACFLRAFSYFDLVRWFGDVPLVTKVVSDPFPAKTSLSIVYDQIIEDLKYAEQYLDDKYAYMDPNGGRVTKAAAKGLLGKVYLTMAGEPLKKTEMFALAELKLKEVIDNRVQYGLAFQPVYRDMFPILPTDATKALNTENMFYSRSHSTLSSVSGSWSFNRIQTWTRQFNFRASSDIINPTETNATGVYQRNDLRRKTNVGRTRGTTLVDIDATGSAISGASAIVVTKYIDFGNTSNSAIDLPILRYTEVLLMYAEALIEQNKDLDIAKGYINMTRGRGGIGNTTAVGQVALRTELRAERHREFFFEGIRRNDLVRWGIYNQTVKAAKQRSFQYHRNSSIGNIDYMDDLKYILFPIPYNDLVANINLVQNTGYVGR